MSQPPSLIALIKHIIRFFFGRRKAKKEAKKARFKKVHDKLGKKYNQVDDEKDKQRQKDVKDRLNNMFDD